MIGKKIIIDGKLKIEMTLKSVVRTMLQKSRDASSIRWINE